MLFASLLLAEPSAFDAPAAQSGTAQNSPQNAQKLQYDQANNSSALELKHSIEGLQTLVVGQGEQLNELRQQFNSNVTSDQPTSLKELNKRFEENLKLQNENFEKINSALSQLAQMIDTISETYVSKEHLKLNLGKGYKDYKNTLKKPQVENKPIAAKPQVSDEKSVVQPTVKDVPSGKLDATYDNAIKEYKANNIESAKPKFEELEKANYPKKAVVEYYLGEIAYKNGDYKTAIEYYQKSVEADEKSPFVPMILYHTAYSLEKLNDKASAKKILQNLITNYPDNYLVPAAKKRLAELK
jgi:TolA-binding protein